MITGFPNQKLRKQSQRYVMMLKECPLRDYTNFELLSDFFNWTMTYRLKSDIPFPYGRILPLTQNGESRNVEKPWRAFNFTSFQKTLTKRPTAFFSLAQRPKLVAWIVSNCRTHSEREKYVKELSKYVNVTIFGQCGTVKCYSKCDTLVPPNYKFLLSFENSVCEEYITEKFFKRLNQNLVPIVLGGGNYSKIAPPHSYIDVLDFQSPEKLAAYLLHLDQSPEEYLSYFWWKDYYRVFEIDVPPICELCQMLHDDKPINSYQNMTSWWREEDYGPACLKKGSFAWSNFA